MKHRIFILAALVAAPACSKRNDVPVLQEDAVAIAKYYAPQNDAFQRRLDALLRQAQGLPSVPPQPIAEVREKLSELVKRDSEVAHDADAIAKDEKLPEADKLAKLSQLVEETTKRNEEDGTVIHDDLTALEGWVARNATPARPAAPPPPPTPPEGELPAEPTSEGAPEAAKGEAAKKEAPKGEAAKKEAPKGEAAKAEPAKKEAPKAEAPKAPKPAKP
jgi:hypothetical protein